MVDQVTKLKKLTNTVRKKYSELKRNDYSKKNNPIGYELPKKLNSNKSDDRIASVKNLENRFPYDEIDENDINKLPETSIEDNYFSVEVTLGSTSKNPEEFKKLDEHEIEGFQKGSPLLNNTEQLEEGSIVSLETLKTSNKFNCNPSITTKLGSHKITILPYKNRRRKWSKGSKLPYNKSPKVRL